jgi:hypothetical protein
VEISDREERARNVDREEDPRARDELAHVEVAAGLARRDRAEAVGRLRRPRVLDVVIRDEAAARGQLPLPSAGALEAGP